MSVMSKKLSSKNGTEMDFMFTTVAQFRWLRNKFTSGSVKQWMLKDGMKRWEYPGSGYCLSKWSEASPINGIRSLVKYVRGYERSSICPLSTVLPSNRLQVLRPSLPGRAAGRSPFLNSVQFKENTCRGHAPIHSYGFAPLVDTRYPCVWPRVLRSHFLQMWHDTDCISGKCSVFLLTKSSSLCTDCCVMIWRMFKCIWELIDLNN